MKAASLIGIDKFGPENDENAFIVNKDLENYSITQKDTKELMRKLKDMLTNASDQKHLCLFFYAGHGMIYQSQ